MKSHLKLILLKLSVQNQDWFVKNDLTGRTKLIKEHNKLNRAFILIALDSSKQFMVGFESKFHVFLPNLTLQEQIIPKNYSLQKPYAVKNSHILELKPPKPI